MWLLSLIFLISFLFGCLHTFFFCMKIENFRRLRNENEGKKNKNEECECKNKTILRQFELRCLYFSSFFAKWIRYCCWLVTQSVCNVHCGDDVGYKIYENGRHENWYVSVCMDLNWWFMRLMVNAISSDAEPWWLREKNAENIIGIHVVFEEAVGA